MAGTTISEVADFANVSVATVDRVLHQRNGVSSKTRNNVIAAIHELGFGQLPPQLMQRPRKPLNFLFLLPRLDTSFVTTIESAILSAPCPSPEVEMRIDIQRVDLTTGAEIISRLDKLETEKYQGVGMFAFDAPGVRDAIDRVQKQGIPIVTLVSDVPSSSRDHYIGIDNTAAGRTAARLMGKFLRGAPGEVGIITGNMMIRDHMERTMGFRQIITADYPQLKLLPPEEGNSISENNRAIASRMLQNHPQLVGIYTVGGGTSGVINSLRKIDVQTRPVLITHERTRDNKDALNDNIVDAVISQSTSQIARGAIATLISSALGETADVQAANVGIDIYVAENFQ